MSMKTMTQKAKLNAIHLEQTGLHITRYYANKEATNGDFAVKVDGGYTTMSYTDYQTWINQK